MNKRWLFLLLCILIAVPSVAAEKKYRKAKRDRSRRLETGASCLNQLPHTEDFTNPYYNVIGTDKVLNDGTEGPFPGSWSQLWTADATQGAHIIYYNGNDYTFQNHNVLSIYVKKYSDYNYVKLSMYEPSPAALHYRASWTWNGSAWVEYENSTRLDNHGEEDLGNGWWRLWLYVDGDTRGIVGNRMRPYIYATGDGAHEGKGNYLYGLNLTNARSTPCIYQAAGDRVYEPLVVKRGIPNDFWYNNQFLDNGTPADGYGDGTEFENVTSPVSLPYWGDNMMDMERTWGIVTSSDVGIAIIDQEISTPHYDLNGNIWKNTDEIPDNGIDDDNDGLVDDYEGWDFFSWDHRPYINGYEDDFATAVAQGSQHGTQMASLIGAVGDNENWLGKPTISSNRQGSVGLLWNVPILACSSLGVEGKTNGGVSLNLNASTQRLACEYMVHLNNHGSNFRILNESYLGQKIFDAEQAYYEGFIQSVGAGNTNTQGGYPYNIYDNTIVSAAVLDSGKTGNRDQTGTGAQDGSTSFGPTVTLSGYGSNSYWYSWSEGAFITPPPAGSYMFTLGYLDPEEDVASLLWEGNINTNGEAGQPVYGMIPTPSWSSGATAQASGLSSIIWGMYGDLTPGQVVAMMERGCVTDIYDGRNVDQCAGGDCIGGTQAWTISTAYVVDDVVRSSGGSYFKCTIGGTSAGNDTDLAGGSDVGVTWAAYDNAWKELGWLGAGRMNAYRSITLWGVVADTTLVGDVYVSGDIEFAGAVFLNTVTFHIAPYDLYQQEIDDGVNVTCQDQYVIDYTGFASNDPNEVTIYITGNTFSNSGEVNTFKSNAKYPQEQDWGGIYTEGAGNFFLLGTTNIENTQTGEFQ